MEASEIKATFLRDPVFSLIPERHLDVLLDRVTEAYLTTGQVVFAAGDEGDALYVVATGKVRIVAPLPDGSEVNLGLVQPGGHFGEQALLTGAPRAATVRAAGDTRLLRLARTDFQALLERVPELKPRFDKLAGEAAMVGFLRRLGKLITLTPEQVQKLSAAVVQREAPAGTVILQEGDPPDKLYVVKSGRIEILQKHGSREYVLGEVPAGGFIGEYGILTGSPRSATAKARTNAQLLEMDGATFLSLVAPTPAEQTTLLEGMAMYRVARVAPEPVIEVEAPQPQQGPGVAHSRSRHAFVAAAAPGATGRACLAMALSELRVAESGPLPGVNDDGMDERSLWSLAEAAESLDLVARGARLTYESLLNTPLPAILPFRGRGYVIVLEVTGRGAVVGDPLSGIRRVGREELLNGWSGRALLVGSPIHVNRDAVGLKQFIPLFRPFWKLMVSVVLAAIVLSWCGMTIPIVTSQTINHVILHHSETLLGTMTSGAILISLFVVALKGLQKYWTLWTATRVNFGMADHFYRHALGLPISFYSENKIGDITGRFHQNEAIQSFFTSEMLKGLLDIALLMFFMSALVAINAKLSLLVIFYIPLYIFMTFSMAPWLSRISNRSFDSSIAAESALIESITGIQTVKGLAIEEAVQRRWERHFTDYVSSQFQGFRIGLVVSSLTSFITDLSTTLIMFFGAYEVMIDQMSMGALMGFYAVTKGVIGPMQRLVGTYGKYNRVLTAVDRINAVLDATPEEPMESRRGRNRIPALTGHVEFVDVKFSYRPDGGPLVLKGINLTLRPGEVVAVVGRSGAGKSTLAHLMMRLQRPTSGTIQVDGYDLEGVDGASLRRQIGVILQDSFLFAGTIRENIAPKQLDASLEKIQAAAALAGAHEFISRMPLGYDTVVGERGTSLSGGQRQRVAIARAIYSDPKILIMDEATSALDTESERAIQENLGKLLSGRTTLIIAHRLTTVQSADRIVVLDSGVIVEEGTHSELMANQGLYYHLASQQIEE